MDIFGISDQIREASAALWSLIVRTLLNPEKVFGSDGLMEDIFKQTWPLGLYMLTVFTISVLSLLVFTLGYGAKYAAKALIILVCFNAAGFAFWNLNQAAIQWNRDMGTKTVNLDASTPPFADIGEGPMQGVAYFLDSVLLAALLVVVLLLIVAQVISGGLIILSFALLPLGEPGHKQWRVVFSTWLVSFVFGLLSIILLTGLAQQITRTVSDVGVAHTLSLAIVMVAIASPFFWYWVFGKATSMITGGFIHTSVDSGDVNTEVQNDLDVTVTNDETTENETSNNLTADNTENGVSDSEKPADYADTDKAVIDTGDGYVSSNIEIDTDPEDPLPVSADEPNPADNYDELPAEDAEYADSTEAIPSEPSQHVSDESIVSDKPSEHPFSEEVERS